MGQRDRKCWSSRRIECADSDDAHERWRDCGDEALRSVRNGWQLFVVEGSGRFADEISLAVRDGGHEIRRS